MPGGYSRSPRLVKGALVRLGEPFLGPVPNVIVFQYNPTSLTRELTPWTPPDGDAEGGASPSTPETAQPYDPGETLTLELELDAADDLQEPEAHPVTAVSGVADRIAALEMLLYPEGESLLGGLFALGGAVPRRSVPVVLLVWGPGRILPVRLTSFSVDEQAFSPTLYPIRAKVSVGLRVLTPDAFRRPGEQPEAAERLAIAAYDFTRGQKEILARANLAHSAESLLGMVGL